jgi:hypothetical protein
MVVSLNGPLSLPPADLTFSVQDDLAQRLVAQYQAASLQPLQARKGGKVYVPTGVV